MSFNKRVYLSGAQKRKKKSQAVAGSKRLAEITSFLQPSSKCASEIDSKSEPAPGTSDIPCCDCDNISGSAKKSNVGIVEIEKTELESDFIAISDGLDNELLQVRGSVFEETKVANKREGLGESESTDREKISKGKIACASNDDEMQGVCTSTLTNIEDRNNPTDKGHFKDVDVPTADEKRFIISTGSCRPAGPFPLDKETGARFSAYYYETTNKAGVKISRSWLCYSEILDCAYCEPCWLFADRKASHFQPAWVNGIRAWRRLSDKIKDHESSGIHHDSCVLYELWRLNKTVDRDLEEQVLRKKLFWCEVLDRIINITLTLATCNLPFRGHREVIGGEGGQNGNFLSIVELLALYDPILKELISKPAGSVRYLSPSIQNEIIDLLSKTVENKIIADIKEAPFFSIILDTTQDISKADQLSQVFRYVKIEKDDNDKTTEIKIKESFLGFKKVVDQTAAGLEKDIICSIENKGIELSKCRGQGYDGAAVMRGTYTGVQRRILDKEENALYVHCCAHNLNLVLNDAVNGIPEVSKFFNTLERIYVFFANSIKRWAILSTFFNSSKRQSKIKLKRLCPTRWSSRNEWLVAIRFKYFHIMQALSKIIITSKLLSEREEACFLRKELETFEFVFQVVLHSKIFMSTNAVSVDLQQQDSDISKANLRIKGALEDLKYFRNAYEDAKLIAIELSAVWKVDPSFTQKYARKTKRHFDELCKDERLTDPESRFRANVFFGCLDIIIIQLQERFNGLAHVIDIFQAIQPQELVKLTDNELYEQSRKLVDKYASDITDTFPTQLMSLRSCLRSSIAKCNTVKDLARLLFIENAALSASFPDVCTVVILFLTIPVTVATAERSFSKLKLIKNYLRSTMGQERLGGLSVLSIEHEEAHRLRKNLQGFINQFAETKVRRQKF